MKCAAYLRLSRQEQDNGVAFERQLFAIEKSASTFSGDVIPEFIFKDLLSGRKLNRPNLEKLIQLISEKRIDAVIFNRVDRLGRDVKVLTDLRYLFEKTGVRAYVCEKQKFMDWKNNDDWLYWTNASVDAEYESRKTTQRLEQVHEFNEHKKQAAFFCPFGYKRIDKKYALDPEKLEVCQRIIDLMLTNEGRALKVAAQIDQEFGVKWTREGLIRWISNPVLRGHTRYGVRSKEKIQKIIYDTHPDEKLLTDEQWKSIELAIADRAKYRGNNYNKTLYPLTGLVYCVCGSKCAVMKNRKWLYIRCRSTGRASDGHGGLIPYETVETAVKQHLSSQAELLINHALPLLSETEAKPLTQEERKILGRIDAIKKMVEEWGDESGRQKAEIADLQERLASLQKKEVSQVIDETKRESLMKLSNFEIWKMEIFTQEKLRHTFRGLIDKVIIDPINRDVLSVSLSFNLS